MKVKVDLYISNLPKGMNHNPVKEYLQAANLTSQKAKLLFGIDLEDHTVRGNIEDVLRFLVRASSSISKIGHGNTLCDEELGVPELNIGSIDIE